jgi:hypothetical protein
VRIKNEWVLRGYEAIGVVAANVSFRDLPFAATLMKKEGFEARAKEFPLVERLLAANITPADGTVRPFTPYVVREVSGKRIGPKPLRVGFLGLTGVPTRTPGGRDRGNVGGFTVGDPYAMAQRYVPELRAKCDVLVVLAYMEKAEARKLGEAAPGIDIIVAAGQYGPLTPSDEAGDAVVVYATNQTKYLGEMRLYRKEGVKDGPIANYLHRDVMLDEAIPDDPAALKITTSAREAFTKVQRAAIAPAPRGGRAADSLERQRATLARLSSFAGSDACASCHQAEHATWKESKHAHAMHTLEAAERHVDPSCTRCHSVGQGLPGGFRNVSLTPRLADVQCESCHTAGKAHIANPSAPYGAVTVPDACVGCHTKENSPDFDFASYWAKIRHGRGEATAATSGR